MQYEDLTSQQKKNLYVKDKLSLGEIAKRYGTYPNKVKRDLVKLGVKFRSKSDAQKLAIKTQRSHHPTRGIGHNEITKTKISNTVGEMWDNFTQEDLDYRTEIGRKHWKKKSRSKKRAFHKKALRKIHEAAKQGSKLEKFLRNKLIDAGYNVEFHKKHFIMQEDLHIDIFLPDLAIAIEVDGRSHIDPIWSQEEYNRSQLADQKKNGLLRLEGIKLIRIRYKSSLSERYKRAIWKELNTRLKGHEKLPLLSKIEAIQ